MIAFESEREGLRDIFVMAADGTGITNVTQTASPMAEQFPAW